MLRSTLVLASSLVTLAACADAPDAGGRGGGGGKADGELTTLSFDADWNEVADGPLVAGSSIRIAYDLDRMTECKSSTGGSEVWGVTGFASFDGGAPKTFGVTRLDNGRVVPVEPELELPAGASHVELWFQINDRFGCNAYDSNEGANYGFDLEHTAGTSVLAFEADFSEDLPAVAAGDQVIVHYDPERLSQCAGSSGGHAVWGVTGFYQVDGGAVKQLAVGRADGSTLVAADPQLTVPRGSDLALWFEATNIWGCHAIDSDLGANYHVAIH
ncbi:MAG TPA: DUF6209 family protein [Kofleriaceae bacterium]|nr:DUF6209 family protein [Kofleriaceae bacterium]